MNTNYTPGPAIYNTGEGAAVNKKGETMNIIESWARIAKQLRKVRPDPATGITSLTHEAASRGDALAREIGQMRALNAELVAALSKLSTTMFEIHAQTANVPTHKNGLPNGPLAAKLMLIGAACRGNLAYIGQNYPQVLELAKSALAKVRP